MMPPCVQDSCGLPHHARGLCDKHYLRLKRSGLPPRPTLEERFWSKVDKESSDKGCWLWIAGKSADGYGKFTYNPEKARHEQMAHRVSYILCLGIIPPGMQIDHLCYINSCVNPKHLRIVTAKQNVENLGSLKRNNTSGYRGVSWHKATKKWTAQVVHNGVQYRLGIFVSASEAGAAAKAKRLELHTHNEQDK